MEIKSTEFFKNMKSLPVEGTTEWDELVKWEEEKCLGGVTIDGVFIPGWLYFHINSHIMSRLLYAHIVFVWRIFCDGLP